MAPGGDVGAVAVWVEGSLGAEVGVEGGKAGSVSYVSGKCRVVVQEERKYFRKSGSCSTR